MKNLILLSLIALAGCTSINSTSFRNMSTSYREIIEEYNNDNILINVVRSSKNVPISFLDIPAVWGTGSVTPSASMGVAGFSNNPASVAGFFSPSPSTTVTSGAFSTSSTSTASNSFTGSIGVSVSNSFTFSQNSLDNSLFMKSFLAPMTLESLQFRGTEQYLPNEVFYMLLFERIEATSSDGRQAISFVNNPLDPNFKRFQTVMEMLMDAGLQVETIFYRQPRGPLIPEQELTKSPAWLNSNLNFEKTVVNGKTYYGVYNSGSYLHLCVNGNAAQALFGNRLSSTMYCQVSPQVKIDKQKYEKELAHFDARYGSPQNFSLNFKLRSLGNVFDYLGNILEAQYRTKNPLVVKIKQSYMSQVNLGESIDAIPLFVVKKNQSISNPIAKVSYRNDDYAIEDEDVTYTKPVVEFVSNLITLSKSGQMPNSSILVK